MSDHLQRAVADVLAYLTKITTDEVPPREAQRLLRAVQDRHPEFDMELVWEVESHDGSLHCDVLVHREGGTTVSMSVCRDRGLPWPLRGVRRWTEANLLQVNGRMLTVEDAVQFLDVLWNEARLMDRMVDTCLIREEVGKRPIEITDEELQEAMDGLRRAHKLHDADATKLWMQQRGMTHEQLERLLVGNLTCEKLRKRTAEGRVADYFEVHRADLDTALIARIDCADEDSAHRLHAQATRGAMDFFEAAQRHSLETCERERCSFATVRRRDASDALGTAVFAANPGDVVGPIRVGRSYVLARLQGLLPARQDRPTYDLIERLLFDEWLAERKQTAKVTWHWGRAPEAAQS